METLKKQLDNNYFNSNVELTSLMLPKEGNYTYQITFKDGHKVILYGNITTSQVHS